MASDLSVDVVGVVAAVASVCCLSCVNTLSKRALRGGPAEAVTSAEIQAWSVELGLLWLLPVAESEPWSAAEWAVAPRLDNPRASVLVLVLGSQYWGSKHRKRL